MITCPECGSTDVEEGDIDDVLECANCEAIFYEWEAEDNGVADYEPEDYY